jgi:hypothetical protein
MRTIDTIGIISNISSIASVNVKATGLPKDRRTVAIVDDSAQVI